MAAPPLGIIGIIRLGLVQTALGSIVVMTTSTLNRVMVVELMLPAMLPGALVGFHYAIQMLRPRWGYGSDVGGRRTPWIIGGMAILAIGGIAAAASTALMEAHLVSGILLATLAFGLIGVGVGASGTTLLALLAIRVDSRRRAAAATIVWLMMIFGMAATATFAGGFLDPFSTTRLITVTSVIAVGAFLMTVLVVWRIEGDGEAAEPAPSRPASTPPFRVAIAQIWAEPKARLFAIFVFVSMLAYSAQDLILEPFAGLVFGLTPGESTALAGVQHGGVFVGMIVVAVAGTVIGGPRLGSLRMWTVGGCVGSAVALFTLALCGFISPLWPLRETVFCLGVANGMFAVAAIGSMMGLASSGRASREGVRMGLWGAAQALAFGLGGFLGTVAVDLMQFVTSSSVLSYSVVFSAEATMFLVAAWLATRIRSGGEAESQTHRTIPMKGAIAGD